MDEESDNDLLYSSDSEDEPEVYNYFEQLSSSSDTDDDLCIEYLFERFGRSPSPDNVAGGHHIDNEEEDLIMPLETDTYDFRRLDNFIAEGGNLICTVCDTRFRVRQLNFVNRSSQLISVIYPYTGWTQNHSFITENKVRFGIHRRRHFAPDHFKCPTCFQGFITLGQCQAHEYLDHEQNQHNQDPKLPKYYFRLRNARKSNVNERFEVDDEDLISIIPSTSIFPYFGPEVNNIHQSYRIEYKYGRKHRKSHSQIQSKYALECRKRNRADMAITLAKLRENENEPNSTANNAQRVATALAHSSTNRPKFRIPDMPDCPKCYFCCLCGFTSVDEAGVHTHGQLRHPEIPTSEVLQFLCIAKSNKNKENSAGGSRRIKPHEKHRAEVEKRERRRERRKEAKLFRKRRDIRRLWEKSNGCRPTQTEFALALGLVRTTDVVLGARYKQPLITSSLLHSLRPTIPSYLQLEKTAKIEMFKINTVEKRQFFCCEFCEYFCVSRADVQRHRRSEHPKARRLSTNTVLPIQSNSLIEPFTGSTIQHTRNYKVKTISNGVESVYSINSCNLSPVLQANATNKVSVRLEDVALTMKRMGTNIGGREDSDTLITPPRKKTRVI